jgi:GTP-binding protein EngB required for normal cell division
MNPEIEQLVRDTIEVTGAAPPQLLNGRGPTLSDDALSATGFYLVGLIGGKEVGKSSLVNALVGQPITQATSYGPGTETVIAYAHESQVAGLKAMLDREVAGQFRIVAHRFAALTRQVLLDLPDIDSHFESHVELTRKMLKHILFPLWVQSVEKYADRQPQQLLATVAGGNASVNFLFCLNKADQLKRQSAPEAIEELRADFASRIAKTLSIEPPRVWMISASEPGGFDLPELRKLLSQEKSDGDVKQSQSLAKQQQDRSILNWLDEQDLSGRLQRLTRLEEEAAELLAARIGSPLIERSLPELAEDPSSKLALTDEVLSARVAHWPVVNLVHLVLTPVLAVVRKNVGATRSATLPDAEALVDAHLRPGGIPVAVLVRNTFALLQQSSPQMSELYQHRRLWEDMASDAAAVRLRTILTDTIEQQRQQVRQKLAGNAGVMFAPLRWLLTIGALIWFPFIQPVLDTLLVQNQLNWSFIHETHEMVVLVVRVFSVSELLQNLEFLAMYFFVLWVILRWHTQRRINRFVAKWKNESSDLSLTVQTVRWLDEMLGPVHAAKETVEGLIGRASALKPEIRNPKSE